MKKLLVLAAAVFCAAAAAITAGAYDLTKCTVVWDPETDVILYFDEVTDELVALEYPDGTIIDVDSAEDFWESYEEPYEPEEEENTNVDYSTLPQPYIDNVGVGETFVYISAMFDRRWAFDEIYIERRDYGKLNWSNVANASVELANSSEYEISFYDFNCESGKTYEYRFTFKSLVDGQWKIMSQLTQTATTDFDEVTPEILSAVATDNSAEITVLVDKKWYPDGCELLRYNYDSDSYTVVDTVSSLSSYDTASYKFVLKDKGLEPNKSYDYMISVFRNDTDGTKTQLCSTWTYITTDCPLSEPEMLEPEAHTDSIIFTATIDERYGADGFVVQKYNTSKKKWVNVVTDGKLSYYSWNGKYDILSAEYTAEKLKSATEYKYRIRFYKDEDGKKNYISTVTASAYTLLPAPVLTLGATKTQSKLSWTKVKNASGYEVYVKAVDPGKDDYYGWGDYYWYYGWYDSPTDGSVSAIKKYNQSYESNTLSYMDISQFKKSTTIKSGSTTSKAFKRKGNKIYVYKIRAYKTVGKKKIYSEYSNQVTTDSTEALLNGLTLKSKVTVSDYDLKLIKAAVKECVKSGMSNAEKAAAVYDYVHNIATYEYDYSKIPADSIEAILVAHRGQCYQYAVTYQAIMQYLGFNVKLCGGKTSSGGPHWWNEIEINGKLYMIDPQVGGRFLKTYDQITVYKEKVYD